MQTESMEYQDKYVQKETAEKHDEVYPCKTETSTNELIFKDKKLICVLNRELCTEEELQDLEQQVEETGMDLKEFLEVFAKILEGHCRVERKRDQEMEAEEE